MKNIIDKIKRGFQSMDPLFWVMIAILVVERLLAGNVNIFDAFIDKLLILPGIIIGVTLHEAGHAYSSYWLGDPTPKAQGRLSLSPFAHMDPLGFIFLLIAGFGWGKPVEINPYYYKNKRRDELIVSLAGVTVNLIIAVVFALITRGLVNLYGYSNEKNFIYYIALITTYVVFINLVLMVFNLIPCPPLDGWGIVTQIFNLRKYDWWYQVYRRGYLILMVLIIFNITDRILTPIVNWLYQLLLL
ncbi:MAG: site-2 protease family protein [Firmicutes bacterium]|nr:site-2 protease family protein [Bacillota bacterium]MCR4710184.1 site-2 protease family protein [Clostridiales bacterium]